MWNKSSVFGGNIAKGVSLKYQKVSAPKKIFYFRCSRILDYIKEATAVTLVKCQS